MTTRKLATVGLSVLVLALFAAATVAAPNVVPSVNAERTNAVQLFQVPEPGVDFLHFTVWDTIEVPNVGTDTVELRGSYQIQREEPTSRNWAEVDMDIRLLDMDVQGSSDVLGRVSVRLNGENVGHVYAPGNATTEADCQVGGQVMITLHDLGVTVFNKEPVPLSHRITHIPPIGQGGSSPAVRIPLYNVANPDGEPVAFLRRVQTQIGGYIG